MLIENNDFVFTGLQAWDNPIGSNCINIAREVARKNRVLFVNPPPDRITSLRRKDGDYLLKRRDKIRNGQWPKLEKVDSNIWVYTPVRILSSINMLPDGWLYDIANKRNNRIYAEEIKAAIDQIGLKNFFLFNDGDMFRSFYMDELLKPAFSIYYSRDYFLAVDYWKRHGRRLEPALMKKSDLVVSNSVYLNNIALECNPNSSYIGQGCELSLFDPERVDSIPPEIESIPAPRIGYIGALTSLRLDIQLLQKIAEARPEWNLILVGPEDEAFQSSELHKLKNIHFTGPKPMKDLASYLKAFNVALNPQKINEVTIGNYPRKIDEYLAIGLAAVATSTDTMKAFKDHVYLGSGYEDYLYLIEKALEEDNAELQKERRNFALGHSWENSVNAIYRAILSSPAYSRSYKQDLHKIKTDKGNRREK